MPTPVMVGTESLIGGDLTGNQLSSVVLGTKDNGYVVAWTDAGGQRSVVNVQFFDEDGEGGQRLTHRSTSNQDIFSPDIALLDNGLVALADVVGNDGNNGSNTFGLGNMGLAILDPESGDGTTLVLGSSGRNNVPRIEAQTGGNFVVSITSSFSGNEDVFAARLDSSLTILNPLAQINPKSSEHQAAASVLELANGGYAALWVDGKTRGLGLSDNTLEALRFNAAGTQTGSAFKLSAGIGVLGGHVDSALLVNGKAAVVYARTKSVGETIDGSEDVFLRVFNANLGGGTREIVVNSSKAGTQLRPKIAALPDGNFVVVWEDRQPSGGDTSGIAIRGQLFAANGKKLGKEFLINTTTDGHQRSPGVAALDDGRFIVTWTDDSFSEDYATGSAIRSQIFDPRFIVQNGGTGDDTLSGDVLLRDSIRGLGGNDSLAGVGGNDTLDGGDGVDVLAGGEGDDVLLGGTGNDLLDGGAGHDSLDGGAGADSLTGGPGDDTLMGRGGNDTLDGSGGSDQLIGGPGNDLYVFGDGQAAIGESSGRDTISSTVSRNLRDYPKIEGLILLGGQDIDGIGNASHNTLVGNAGDNTLDGGSRHDSLAGGLGNDLLLGSHGWDTLDGGSGVDTLSGGYGFDVLTGGPSQDSFVFDTTLSVSLNVDTISDFTPDADTIVLDRKIFKALQLPPGQDSRPLDGTEFAAGKAATEATQRIVYNPLTGVLLYDPDGSGAKAGVRFAVLDTNLALTGADFLLT